MFVFAMYYDLMSYVAQQLGGYLETGVSLQGSRKKLTDVIKKGDEEFTYSKWTVSNGIIAILREVHAAIGTQRLRLAVHQRYRVRLSSPKISHMVRLHKQYEEPQCNPLQGIIGSTYGDQ